MTGKATFTATCDRELTPANTSGQAPEWVHLIPLGEMVGRDGRVFKLTNPQALLDSFTHNGADLPVDYDHQNDKPIAGPVPAAGWIKELCVKKDGIWGRVEWTATANEMIGRKEYRYLSPTFNYLRERTVVRLKGAGLVHSPNLHLTALASEETDMNENEPDQDAFKTKLAALLKLPKSPSFQTSLESS